MRKLAISYGLDVMGLLVASIVLAFLVWVLGWFLGSVILAWGPNQNAWARWTFGIVLATGALAILVRLMRQEVLPAWRTMKVHQGVSFHFALEHHRKSREYIGFLIAKPIGYEPWGQDEFHRWCKRASLNRERDYD